MNETNPPPQPETTAQRLPDLNQAKEVPPKFYEHATLLVLFYDRWFRFAAILFVLALIIVGMMLPRIWRVTPAHMPIVRISGLDFMEAASLRRAAEKLSESGQVKEALSSWRSSVENNPGNSETIRKMLQFINRQTSPPNEFVNYAAMRGVWLLSLSKTNLADLSLVIETLEKIQEDSYVATLAGPRAVELSASALGALARSEFRLGQMEKFDTLWQLQPEALSKQTETALFRMAWEAGFGPPSSLVRGQMQLQHALVSTNEFIAETAHHLTLIISYTAQDIVNYQRMLDWLVEHHVDRVTEHINYWRLLVSVGRRSEAHDLAKAFSRPPNTADEALGIATVLSELEMEEVGIEFLEKNTSNFGFSAPIWVALADLRIKKEKWSDLFAQGVSMRRDEHLGGSLDGYSFFVEGLSNAKTGRSEAAARAFKNASESRFSGSVYLAFKCAREMREAGFPTESENLLRKLQTGFTKQAEYWFELSLAAFQSRDMQTFSMAAEKAYTLEPDKDGYVQNYAAVLLAEHRKPEESVKLTRHQLEQFPNNSDLQVNHALALIQNNRFDAAETILKRVNPNRLNSSEASNFNYAWAVLHLERNDPTKARKSYSLVNTNFILPPEVLWIESKLKTL